ncbi:MAG: methyltransferase [Holophagales bacterium]|nr:methyltransferase [Holophagales bacterium]
MATNRTFPLALEKPELFAPVREFLRRASYDDATLCRTLRMGNMSDLGGVRWDEVPRDELGPALNLCLDLFLLCREVPGERIRDACGEVVADALQALGLVRTTPHDASQFYCPVWLYPVDGFVIASDRRNEPYGDAGEAFEDVVFPAIHVGALRLLDLMPDAGGGDALDLCGGAGSGAFRFSRTARSVATSDLTLRSARFAEFNARLNGLDVESLQGDLYEPAAGRRFDAIAAHPPFVPAAGSTLVYRDGGDTGEEVTRRVVEGLPAHLKPGGRCAIICMGRDADEGSFEQRVRGWLGEARDEFDVVFGHETTLTVDDVIDRMKKRDEPVTDGESQAFRELLVKMGTKRFVYGVLRIERFPSPAPLEPLRLEMSPGATAIDFEPFLAWRRLRREPGLTDRIGRARPRLAPGVARTGDGDGSGQAAAAPVDVSLPAARLGGSMSLEAWAVPLVSRLDGSVSVDDLFAAAERSAETPSAVTRDDLVALVARLVDRGLLEPGLAD